MTLAPRPRPKVIIVGAGIAGLMMGILLDKMDIPYQILERAPKVKPLGALMSFNGNILALFDQLGLLDEAMKISFKINSTCLFDEKLNKLAEVNTSDHRDRTGYDFIVFSRPELYEIIRSRVPEEKVLMNKKVSSIKKTDTGVEVTCSDNTTYDGHILIGADGAYSTVRQKLYAEMEAEGVLPHADTQDMAMPYICMVGTTTPQDPAKYPELKGPVTNIHHVIGSGTSYSWTVITIPGNRFCWSVMQQITDPEEAKAQRFRNSEWGPEATESMINAVRGYPITFGGGEGVLGDILDATPKDVVSKVMLEEKLFETWHHGNTVLIGDAVHKMLPTSGQGAINAMQDAVILANCIYDLEDLKPESLTAAFESYKQQRHNEARKQVNNSAVNAKISSGQTFFDRVIRHVVLNYIPRSLQDRQFTKDAAYRPQCTFLERIPDKGAVASLPQLPSKRYQAEKAAAAAAV
ncbi:hypothetical protein BGX29_002362 [Mortierella sp. GBA35]|nr:hypothetical protein BGX23_004800 [Mortierella sp. AD031]KAF9108219.1 hypothetical protein BGX29_002362 [Mortierella sp. GBA35]KAG0208331.1 hypothetical protein BGX33_006337 [Mortierella sp. NVP41]